MMRCQQFIQRFVRGPTGVYRQAFLSLLLAAGSVFALMSFTACDCDNNGVDDCNEAANSLRNAQIASMNSQLAKDSAPSTTAKIYGTHDVSATLSSTAATASIRYYRFLWVNVDGDEPSSVTYTWRPPTGASDFVFSDQQPEPGWDPAHPVLVFRNIPPSKFVPITFALPSASPYGGDRVAESLVAQPSAGPATTAYLLTPLTDEAEAAPVKLNMPSAPEAAADPQAVTFMWEIQRWYGRDVPITSALCQQAVDLLQSDAAFVALQLPERGQPGTESTLLPVYYTPTLELINPTNGMTYLEGAGAFRPDHFTFAASELPHTDRKIWATFGAAQSPKLTCPAGLNTSDWEIHLNFQLDLSYAPDFCRGCTLDVFLCYEGQELPGSRLAKYVARQQANRMLEHLIRTDDGQAGVRDYRDWGVTCAGPLPLQLIDDADWSDWMLLGASAQAVTPTWPITLSHVLEGGGTFIPPRMIDLAFNSNLAAGWHWSDGTQVITPPVSYNGTTPKTIYLVGQAPAGASAGMYSTQITASLYSQPTDYRVATDLIWVGEWVPPPHGDATPTASPTATPIVTPTATATTPPTATRTPTVTHTPTVGPTPTATLTAAGKRYLPVVLH
jgi:hypothetical protein